MSVTFLPGWGIKDIWDCLPGGEGGERLEFKSTMWKFGHFIGGGLMMYFPIAATVELAGKPGQPKIKALLKWMAKR